jgi:ABC-type uncharacterized transport system substrate-binding protein
MQRRAFITLLGGVAVWPPTARAQQTRMRMIGYLSGEATTGPSVAFLEGLSEAGYVQNENLAIEHRGAGGRYDRLPEFAADLVGRKVEVIATIGMPAALAAKSATSVVPIVFNVGVDPVADGLVASLARPGGNLTGVTIMSAELISKRLELLSELIGHASVIALLVNPNNASAEPQSRDLSNTAHAKGLQLHILKASTEAEINSAFASLVQLRPDALIVGTDIYFYSQRDHLVALAARAGVPAVYEGRAFVTSGGLISYGPSSEAISRQHGSYVGKILNGAKPPSLPIQQPDKFELVINFKTARALGLNVPQVLLARADEVIE